MDSEQEINIVYTCGLCEMICDVIDGHGCIEGYSKVTLNENHYFYPILDDGSIVCRSEDTTFNQENVDPNILQSPESTQNKNRKLTDVEVEILILEVSKRESLWNFTLPLEQRTKEISNRLWNEVSVELNGKITGTEVQKKFKSLKDTYRKIIQAEQHASGSARLECNEKWKYYEAMEFLRDSCLIRRTESNVHRDSLCRASDEEESSFLDHDADLNESGGTRRKKSRKNSQNSDTSSAINRIADAICKEDPPVILPAPPVQDEVDFYLSGARVLLRRLPFDIRLQTIMDFLQVVQLRVREYTNASE